MAVQVLNEWQPTDRFVVPKAIQAKYPGKHFCFVRNDEDRVSQKLGDGYEVAFYPEKTDKSKTGKMRGDTSGQPVDLTCRRGDTILMVLSQERYESQRKYITQKVDNKFKRSSASIKKQIESIDDRIDVKETLKKTM